jgi:alpha-1,2-mannosyltransferase
MSFSRAAGLYSYYHAPLSLYEHFYRVVIPNELAAGTPMPTYDNPIDLCVGKEWYRFPSHYFLPEGVRLRFLESDFRGQLPQYFLESTYTDSEGRTVSGNGRDGTWQIPPGFNDQNKEETARYVSTSNT